jgi:large subunit ribosomal protein L24
MIMTQNKNKIHVKNGDIVQVITGSYKNQVGQIIKVLPKTSQVVVKGLNVKTKHSRPKQQEESGKIISFEGPIHSSNVMLYSAKNKVRSRYCIAMNGSVKHRRLNKTQEIIE